jgi:large subunit ribosomal protein L2
MLVNRKPVTPGQRNRVDNKQKLAANNPVKSLTMKGVSRRNGRNSTGQITVRHRGGGAHRKYRVIDWKRDKLGIPAKVVQIEYDPHRSAHIALLNYADGEKRYILAPKDLQVGETLMSGPEAELRSGNALSMRDIPLGMPVHNIEVRPGKGGQLVRGAGTAALIQSKDENYATILLPSREVRLVPVDGMATLGEIGNADHKNRKLGKAGRKRHMGIRPTVRGAVMHPAAHPHGGGEGKNGVGLKHPKTPWGKPALGKKTRRKRKYSDKMIVQDRRQKSR